MSKNNNFLKNQADSSQNQEFCPKNEENSAKITDFSQIIQENTAQDSEKVIHRVEGLEENTENSKEIQENQGILVENEPILEENQAVLSKNQPKSPENTEICSDSCENQGISVTSDDFSKENQESELIPPCSGEKEPKSSVFTPFEAKIEQGFNDLVKIYPNISKSALLCDNYLKMFAHGKENQGLSDIYSDYLSFVAQIEENAIKKEQMRQATARVSVGALSSSVSNDDGYFSKEQVQRMSKEEISRNFEKIRKSQQRW